MLDALPGEVRAGDANRRDHPADLIVALQQLRMPIEARSVLQTYLTDRGFSDHIAKWASTNLKAVDGDVRSALMLCLQRESSPEALEGMVNV